MKAVVIFSGGQDSTTCLVKALQDYDEVECVSFDYGQQHSVELRRGKAICERLGVKQTVFTTDILTQIGDSALLASNEDEVGKPHRKNKDLPSSFVPNRNAFFITMSHAYAQKINAQVLVTGVCETDYSGYPDCRLAFIKKIEDTLNSGSTSDIEIVTPLMHLDKADTFKLAEDVGALGIVLEDSHTCYNGDHETNHPWGYGCGKCPACELREAGYNEYLKRYHNVIPERR